VVYEGATPIISSAVMKIISVDARLVRGSLGVQYIVTLGNNQKWLVYCSEPVALVWRDNTLYSPNPIHGFIRVAILPAQNFEAAFTALLQVRIHMGVCGQQYEKGPCLMFFHFSPFLRGAVCATVSHGRRDDAGVPVGDHIDGVIPVHQRRQRSVAHVCVTAPHADHGATRAGQ
jgi:Glycosyl hydrolase family 81 N-terminal domain